jgi:hypothetical protein
MKGDLQRAFPLDIPMVPSSAITVTADGEHLMCGGFSQGELFALGASSSSSTTWVQEGFLCVKVL